MTDHKRIPFPKEAGPLKQQVQAWRKARSGPEPMPDALWNDAVQLARQFGVCLIARAVGIDYSALRNKVRKAMEMPVPVKQPAFIELPLSPGAASGAAEGQGGPWGGGPGSLIEISRPRHGSRWDRGCLPREPPLIQITPQMRILVAVEPVDFRCGIDGLAQICRNTLAADPFSGTVFVFRGLAGPSIKLLTFDGQGYWLCQKRLSKGRFRWWPPKAESASARLLAHELQVLICGGDPRGAKVPPAWRPVGLSAGHDVTLNI